MNRRTISISRTTGALVSALLTFSCCPLVHAAGQHLIEDPASWVHYELQTNAGIVDLSVPAGHRFKDAAQHQRIPERDGQMTQQIFSAQYDYGWRRWSSIAQFEVFYTLVKLRDPASRAAYASDALIAIGRAYESDQHRPNHVAESATETLLDEHGVSWTHAFPTSDSTKGFFFQDCGADHLLLVTAAIYGEDLARNPDWVTRRRALARKMLSTVRCRQAAAAS